MAYIPTVRGLEELFTSSQVGVNDMAVSKRRMAQMECFGKAERRPGIVFVVAVAMFLAPSCGCSPSEPLDDGDPEEGDTR